MLQLLWLHLMELLVQIKKLNEKSTVTEELTDYICYVRKTETVYNAFSGETTIIVYWRCVPV